MAAIRHRRQRHEAGEGGQSRRQRIARLRKRQSGTVRLRSPATLAVAHRAPGQGTHLRSTTAARMAKAARPTPARDCGVQAAEAPALPASAFPLASPFAPLGRQSPRAARGLRHEVSVPAVPRSRRRYWFATIAGRAFGQGVAHLARVPPRTIAIAIIASECSMV